MDLPQVMNQAEERPLDVAFNSALTRESVQVQDVADVRKDWLHDSDPLTVDPSPNLLHRFSGSSSVQSSP